ncbi:MAG: YqzL family protein [Halanaerobiaceae bacterium]
MVFLGITATFFWRIFEETGSIDAYLAYRKVFKNYSTEKSEKNYIV